MTTSTRRQFLQWTAAGVAGMIPLAPVRGVPSQTVAVGVGEFLASLGACSAISRRGEKLANTVEAAKYLGLRWFRVGYEKIGRASCRERV